MLQQANTPLHCCSKHPPAWPAETPQWRDGPYGLKTACNACGIKYKRGNLPGFAVSPLSGPVYPFWQGVCLLLPCTNLPELRLQLRCKGRLKLWPSWAVQLGDTLCVCMGCCHQQSSTCVPAEPMQHCWPQILVASFAWRPVPAQGTQCACRSQSALVGMLRASDCVTLLHSLCPRPERPVCLQKPDSAGKRVAAPKRRRMEEIALDDSEQEYNPLESDISEPESVPKVRCC